MALRQASPGEMAASLLLAGLAGFVDAIGYSHVGGFFVSFMSGNTTRLGLDLVGRDWTKAASIAEVIGSFVGGATLGTALGALGPGLRRPSLLSIEAAALATAIVLGQAGWRDPSAMLMALAMGMENEVFVNSQNEARMGLTYVSGALVKIGEGLGHALRGGPLAGWWPFAALWLSLLAGVIGGGGAYRVAGLAALWPASILLLVAAAAFLRIDRGPPAGV